MTRNFCLKITYIFYFLLISKENKSKLLLSKTSDRVNFRGICDLIANSKIGDAIGQFCNKNFVSFCVCTRK